MRGRGREATTVSTRQPRHGTRTDRSRERNGETVRAARRAGPTRQPTPPGPGDRTADGTGPRRPGAGLVARGSSVARFSRVWAGRTFFLILSKHPHTRETHSAPPQSATWSAGRVSVHRFIHSARRPQPPCAARPAGPEKPQPHISRPRHKTPRGLPHRHCGTCGARETTRREAGSLPLHLPAEVATTTEASPH